MAASQRSVSPMGLGGSQSTGGADHIISHRHRISQKEYPEDCPPIAIRWHYAVDVPKRKPFQDIDGSKPTKAPTKFVPFGKSDSKAIETAYLRISEEEDAKDAAANSKPWTTRGVDDYLGQGQDLVKASQEAAAEKNKLKKKSKPNSHLKRLEDDVTVPVNEDYLFDVAVKSRELAPAYWDGPVYEVLRGTWFIQEGTIAAPILKPLDETLAAQVEEGYLRIKPFRQKKTPASLLSSPERKDSIKSDTLKPETAEANAPTSPSLLPQQQQTWRLLGAHMGQQIVYVDSTTAWLLTDTLYGQLASTVYQRMTSGQNLGGVRLTRGWVEKVTKIATEKASTGTNTPRPTTPAPDKRKSMPLAKKPTLGVNESGEPVTEATAGRIALERKMSNLLGITGSDDPEKVMEEEMKDDYKDSDENDQSREIDHLILVTHGIGQRLSMRMESVNFIHDVNVFRKTVKAVYAVSPDLQALNQELEGLPQNCRVQVLPICWRHLLDFPKQALRANKLNSMGKKPQTPDEYGQDLGHGTWDEDEYDSYPSLEDITVEGVPAVRSLITDLALDILLYQSAYREHIAGIVLREANRVYDLFSKRNPGWNGRVSMVGHSLGSAILFDILCRQGRKDKQVGDGLNFYCENFFAYGSPIGLFQMLEGKTIASRIPPNFRHTDDDQQEPLTPYPHSSIDPFFSSSPKEEPYDPAVSAPLCTQLFNIFHPTDPISYRLEPLVTKAMSEMKPQLLPYTKKGLLGNQLAGLTGIGQRVTNMWSSLSGSIASSILNRSLGFSGDGPPVPSEKKIGDELWFEDEEEEGHQPTLIDGELDTLYAGFQKRRKLKRAKSQAAAVKDGEKPADEEEDSEDADETTTEGERKVEEKARKLKREERKLRALNRTGRIDFAIQEGTFDISLIASIASHLSYWSDEDVNSFVLSQLLSRKKKAPPKAQEYQDSNKLMAEE